MRQVHGFAHNFNGELSYALLFFITSGIISVQLLFGLLGFKVMKRMNYFKDFIHGDKHSPVSFALICPGVALFVFGMFFIFFGLIKNGVVDRFSVTYFALLLPLTAIQFKTVSTFFKLKKKLI